MNLQCLLLLTELLVEWVLESNGKGTMATFIEVVRFALASLQLDVI